MFQNFVVFFRQQGKQAEKTNKTPIILKELSVSFSRFYIDIAQNVDYSKRFFFRACVNSRINNTIDITNNKVKIMFKL